MPLPAPLTQQIMAAFDLLDSDPMQTLQPSYRRALYISLGSRTNRMSHHTRAWLDILTAQRLLPQWYHVWPNDHQVERLLETAIGLLKGVIDVAQTHRILTSALEGSDLSGISEVSSFFHASSVYEVATLALLEACGHDSGDQWLTWANPLEPAETNWCDAAGWAAMIEGGGTWHRILPNQDVGEWNRTSDDVINRQRGFWRWWLQEAWPTSWQTALWSTQISSTTDKSIPKP